MSYNEFFSIMKLKCIAVDDEPLALMVITHFIEKIPDIELIATYENALDLYEVLQAKEIDVLFLDIEMPELSGIEFVKSLTKAPYIVFTTANKTYALESYELNVVDYLIKPVTFERLLKSVNKIRTLHAKNANNPPQIRKTEYIFLNENKKHIKVYFKDILYMESIKDYVKVVTNTKTVITKQTLNFFEDVLDKEKFLRIHRSFIIAIDHVTAYTCTDIEIGNIEIPIGRNYKDIVMEILDAASKMENANEENL